MQLPGTPSPILLSLLICAVVCIPSTASGESGTVGSVKTATGTASVRRGGVELPAKPGLKLEAGDTLSTAPGASLGVILRDDSLLSLGPSTTVAIEKFLFAPAAGKLGITARILRGTMAYVTGIIGRLAPESAAFVTPVATIGIRGTHFAVRVAE